MLKDLLTILLGGIIANNYALTNYLGTANFLGFADKKDKTVCVGLGVTAVITVSAAVSALLDGVVPAYLHTLVWVVVVLAVAALLNVAAKAVCKKSCGFCLPLVALNSAVLGVCLNNTTLGYSVLESVVSALGVGLGFLVGMLVFAGVLDRIEDHYVPKALRGLPIQLIAAGLVSLAVSAF
ncbi:MAG: hypothetical protein IKV55_06610 [Oscillospiraceae bacterium]|nr:hypothetical protein [Oscillospiraceae bacterium]